jgi:hypothetical protein
VPVLDETEEGTRVATRKRSVTLTRPELPARSYDFSKPEEAKGDGEAGAEKTKNAGEITPHHTPQFIGGVGGLSRSGTKKQTKTGPDPDAVLADLLALSAADRRDLLARLALAEKEAKGGKGREVEMWSGAVYDALEAALGSASGVGAGRAHMRRLLADPSSWGPVASFWQQTGLGGLRVVEQQACWNLLAGLLVQHAARVSKRTGSALTPRYVASMAANLVSIFDASFPGYLSSPRLIAVMARQLTTYKEPPEEDE